MKTKLITLVALVIALTGVSCAYQKMEYGTSARASNETPGESLDGNLVWLKNRKDGVDILLQLRNQYKFPVVVKYSDLTLELAGEKAFLKSPISGVYEIMPGQVLERVAIFKFAGEKVRAGKAKITLTKVLEGPIENIGKRKLKALHIEAPVTAKQ